MLRFTGWCASAAERDIISNRIGVNNFSQPQPQLGVIKPRDHPSWAGLTTTGWHWSDLLFLLGRKNLLSAYLVN